MVFLLRITEGLVGMMKEVLTGVLGVVMLVSDLLFILGVPCIES